jgi:FixJ family two-component response regulator
MSESTINLPTKDGVVYIVDDDEAMRDSMTWLLQANGYKTSCHASAERFLQALSATDDSTVACALLDIRMPAMTGIELQEKLIVLGHDFPIAFITGHGEVAQAVNAFKLGAIDFIQKPFKEEVLCELVEKMLAKAFLDQQDAIDLENLKSKFKTLTPREEDVLNRIAVGLTNKEVSAALDISVKTVEAHRANIMDKLRVNRPAKLLQLIIKYQDAQKKGLIPA